MSSLVDQSRLSSEPLAFTNRRGNKIGAVLLVVLIGPLMAWFGTRLIMHPDVQTFSSRRARLIEGHGVFTQMWGVLFILIALWTVYNLIPVFLNRVVLTRQGIQVVKVTGSTFLPWPPSRSAFAVTSQQNKGYSCAVWLITAEGKAITVPGTTRGAGAARRELANENLKKAVGDADTMWEWGVSRGLTQESGQYVTTTNRTVESTRLTPEEEEAFRRS